MRTVECYAWHFMPWPYLPKDFDERYESGWVTVPNSLFDREKAKGLYQEYLEELVDADRLGFDGSSSTSTTRTSTASCPRRT